VTWAFMNDVPRGLLREALRGRMTPERSAGCLDSQTLAAWSEGTLNARDRETIEEHASGCARCQALLAAMVTTDPPVAPSRWWRPSTFGWLAPLAAAAAAILLWINVRPSSVDQPSTSPVTATALPAPRSSATVPSPLASPSSAPPQAADRRPVASRTRARATPAPVPPAAAATSPPPPLDNVSAIASAQKKEAPPPAEPPPAPATKGAPAETRDVVVVPRTAAPVAVSAPLPRVEAPLAGDGGAASKFAGAGGRGGGGLAAAPVAIVSPDPNVRWQVFPPSGGRVARSTDGGDTWQMQSTTVNVALTAGAAPAATVCWLVGAAGTVVLSTDGRTWQRLPFPQTIDLVSVRASDAANATVTSADGRTFSTTDGGKTWRQP
jgi:hypothetical protein